MGRITDFEKIAAVARLMKSARWKPDAIDKVRRYFGIRSDVMQEYLCELLDSYVENPKEYLEDTSHGLFHHEETRDEYKNAFKFYWAIRDFYSPEDGERMFLFVEITLAPMSPGDKKQSIQIVSLNNTRY